MILTINGFGGEQPRLGPSNLPPYGAQAALNCEFSSGELRAHRGLTPQVKRSGGLTNVSGFFVCDDGNLFTWIGNGWTIAKSPVIGDFWQRVYFTNAAPSSPGVAPSQLRVVSQYYAVAGVGIWDTSKTYSLGEEVTWPATVPADYSVVTRYTKGSLTRYPVGAQPVVTNNIVYRCITDDTLGVTPGTDATRWELFGIGRRWVSLAGSNISQSPAPGSVYWEQNAVSLMDSVGRAGVPAPAAWSAKLYGVGSYNVAVIAGDPTGALSAYNVPSAIADIRAAADGSTTGSLNDNSLIAIARNTWIENLILKASPDDAVDTARAYYAAGDVKQQESVVQLYTIEKARMYAFDAPVKDQATNEFVITQMYVQPAVTCGGNNTPDQS